MTAEAKAWIKNNYGTTFKINGKNEYKTSIPQITAEEETYHNELNDYIIDRLKVITIDETTKTKQKLYMEALKGKEENNKQEKEHQESKSTINNIGIPDKNNSDITNEEIEDLIHETQNSAQMKMIKEL